MAKRRSLPPFIPFTKEKKEKFLTHFAKTCHIGKAAKRAGVTRQTIYNHRREDPEFAKRFEDARLLGIEALEDKAVELATEDENPNHLLLMFLLKGNKPEKYRERSDVNVSGELKVTTYTIEDLRKAREQNEK